MGKRRVDTMTDFTRAQFITRMLQLPEAEIVRADPGEILHALRETVPQEVWKIGLQTSGEDGRPAQFWRIRGNYYLDDPTFTNGLVDFLDMDYNTEIGLHVRPGKSALTAAKLPPPGTAPPQPSSPSPPTTVLASGPYKEVFLALNYYISTGDHIGEGQARPLGNGRVHLLIPYAPREREDKENWERLQARLTQIQTQDKLALSVVDLGPASGNFRVMAIEIAAADVARLAQVLKAKPGPLGWGSLHAFLQQHGLA